MLAAVSIDPPSLSEWELVARLTLATVLGAVVGLEREWRDRTAGLRTHMLVCLGSTAFTIVSAYGFMDWYGQVSGDARSTVVSDPTRIAAQIVSGIGFLGAGAIFRSDDGVKGLTTAASLWVMAAIGLAVGAGYYSLGIACTVLILLVLVALRQVGQRIKEINRGDQTPVDVVVDGPAAIGSVLDTVASVGGTVGNFSASNFHPDDPRRQLGFDLSLPADESLSGMIGRLAMLEGVDSVSAREMPTSAI